MLIREGSGWSVRARFTPLFILLAANAASERRRGAAALSSGLNVGVHGNHQQAPRHVAGPPTRRVRGARQAELHRRLRHADPQRRHGHRQRPRLCGRRPGMVKTRTVLPKWR